MVVRGAGMFLAGILLSGCHAHREVAERVTSNCESAVSAEQNTIDMKALCITLADDLTIERPEIILHDTAGHRSVTIKGERLRRERATMAEACAEQAREVTTATQERTETSARREAVTDAGTVRWPLFATAAAIILLLVSSVKKMR